MPNVVEHVNTDIIQPVHYHHGVKNTNKVMTTWKLIFVMIMSGKNERLKY